MHFQGVKISCIRKATLDSKVLIVLQKHNLNKKAVVSVPSPITFKELILLEQVLKYFSLLDLAILTDV